MILLWDIILNRWLWSFDRWETKRCVCVSFFFWCTNFKEWFFWPIVKNNCSASYHSCRFDFFLSYQHLIFTRSLTTSSDSRRRIQNIFVYDQEESWSTRSIEPLELHAQTQNVFMATVPSSLFGERFSLFFLSVSRQCCESCFISASQTQEASNFKWHQQLRHFLLSTVQCKHHHLMIVLKQQAV